MNQLFTLAQNSGGGGGGGAGGAAAAGGLLIIMLIYAAIFIAIIAGMWKTFTKAGQPGWAAIVPIYNIYIWTKIVGRPWWWLLLMFIPIVSIVVAIVLCVDLAKSFGKGIGFAIGLILLGFVFIPILGFGSAQYQGPSAGA
ncbi:MAG TPA: DUF5684 domain-containing protein [Phycisphaerales bacterium]|nr:DUF5684 domain-containing protein [Phycisphaerales bacterium]